MIRRMRIRNFKAYGPDRDWFSLGPTTFILGANSSGKSTMLQVFRVLQQSWKERSLISALCTDGEKVRLGPAWHVCHNEDVASPISFDFEFGNADRSRTHHVGLRFRASHDQHDAVLESIVAGSVDGALLVWDVLPFGQGPEGDIASPSVFWARLATTVPPAYGEGERAVTAANFLGVWCQNTSGVGFEGGASEQGAKDLVSRHLELFDLAAESGIDVYMQVAPEGVQFQLARRPWLKPQDPEDVSAEHDEKRKLAEAATDEALRELKPLLEPGSALEPLISSGFHAFDRLFKVVREVRYIGPQRNAGRRMYPRNPNRSVKGRASVGRDGAWMAHALAEQEHHIADVDRMLAEIGVPYRVAAADYVGSTDAAVELRLRRADDEAGRLLLDLCDVGYGVSQVLPILTQVSLMARDPHDLGEPGLLLLEQPELHLHPRWQSGLASVLLNSRPIGPLMGESEVQSAARTRALILERTMPQVIAETHSEATILRVQRLIRTRALLQSEAVVLAVSGGRGVKEIPVADDGWIDPEAWPDGFFGDRFDEIRAGLEA